MEFRGITGVLGFEVEEVSEDDLFHHCEEHKDTQREAQHAHSKSDLTAKSEGLCSTAPSVDVNGGVSQPKQ